MQPIRNENDGFKPYEGMKKSDIKKTELEMQYDKYGNPKGVKEVIDKQQASIFDKIDTNKDGVLDRQELKAWDRGSLGRMLKAIEKEGKYYIDATQTKANTLDTDN